MPVPGLAYLRLAFTTPYEPQPALRSFLDRGQTQCGPAAAVTAAVADAAESGRVFGVPLARRGIQAVYLRVENRGDATLRLQVLSIDPNYFTPLEAAGVCHHSLVKWPFLLGSEYRYSPVSPLYLFGRSQDVALQRSRRSINERLHLRLWLTPVRFRGRPVWVGQISRDIGVRFTARTWNLTTHRIDPEVDEARDYVVEDLLEAERLEAAGYVDGVGACGPAAPRRNLTGEECDKLLVSLR